MSARIPRVGYPACHSWGLYGRLKGDARCFFTGPYPTEDVAFAMGELLFWDKPGVSYWNVQPWLPKTHYEDSHYEWVGWDE